MNSWKRSLMILVLGLTAAAPAVYALTSGQEPIPSASPASPASSASPAAPVASPKPTALPSAQPTPWPKLSNKAWLYISKKSQKLYIKDTVANKEQTLSTWPVSTARYSVSTPVGRFKVVSKYENPPYSGRHGYFPPKHPKNPLGTRWMALNVGHFRTRVTIGIHGTAEPEKVGQAVSDGCIRLRNTDVEQLFKLVNVGMPVVISNQ